MKRVLTVIFAGFLATIPLGVQAESLRPKARPEQPAPAREPAPEPPPAPLATETAPKPDTADTNAKKAKDGIGPATNLPLPRFVSLKGSKGYARRGPGLTHKIDWVFTAPRMPLLVTAEYEHWRRVEDADGMGGWVHYTLLSGVRTVIVDVDMADFFQSADANAPVMFKGERNVIARLEECQLDWCQVSAENEKGWAPKSVLWGTFPLEVFQ